MNHESEILRAFGTLRSMLVDRAVDGCAQDLEGLSGEALVALAANNSVFFVDLVQCRHRIVFDLASRFKLLDVRKVVDAPPASIDVVVMVVRDVPTTAARKSIDELGRDIQIFELRELQYNVTHHVLVPRHVAIRDETAVREVLRRYQLKSRYQMPLIMSTDPVARYLALKPGQLVRITRPSPSCGLFTCYRCCMKA